MSGQAKSGHGTGAAAASENPASENPAGGNGTGAARARLTHRPQSRGAVKNESLSVAITELWATPGYRDRNLAGGRRARASRPPRPSVAHLRSRTQQEERAMREANLRRVLIERLESAPRGLSAHQREVLTLRFGLDGGGVRTLEEVGRHFGSSRSAVQQSEQRALRRLAWPQELRLLVPQVRQKQAAEGETDE